jgi:2-hydroxychromene-2-carboxylate isomerase
MVAACNDSPARTRRTLEFWFEFASTYSYPAAFRVEEVARTGGVGVEWRAFLLGPIFQGQGWNDSPFNLYPAKGRYMWRDLERICGELGFPFRRPSRFPRQSLLAARVACRFAAEAWLPDFVRSVYRANFAEDLEIGDRHVVAGCLDRLGLPSADLLAAAETPESKQALRAQTERGAALGIFGAPSFVADGELFWGNDRLEAAVAWCRAEGRTAPQVRTRAVERAG